MKDFDPALLAEVRGILKVEPGSKDPAILWLAQAFMIAADTKGLSVKEGIESEELHFVYHVLETYKDTPTAKIKAWLRESLKEFEAAGGRGVELADRIDGLRIILAIRRKMKTLYSWHGPREWSPRK